MAALRFSIFRLIALSATLCLLTACGGGSSSGQTPTPPALPPTPPPTAPTPPSFDIGGFKTIDETEWTPVAVNKVLHTFALGGHATDGQIELWSQMHPVTAVQEMLTFEPHNLKLSPPAASQQDGLQNRDASLASLAEFWSSDDPGNTVPDSRKSLFDYSGTTGWLEHLWPTALTVRGLNPFLQRIAYFEVNQHMAVSLGSVPVTTIIRYYDDVSKALSDGRSYDEVMAVAASSAAIAQQYGHRLNRFVNGECLCNEDFAREFYQLFFGITGSDDSAYHETVTIKNTALALTDLRIQRDVNGNFLPHVEFSSEFHPSGPLEMLGTSIGGTHAQERLLALAQVAIEHPESLGNLPIMLVSGLADDALSETGKATLRSAWASMAQKDLLLFLRAYAVSELFHSESRVKYWNSMERRMLITNKVSNSNEEIYHRIYSVVGHLFEGISTFKPVNNVFGDQTGVMAADSMDVFRQNFNQNTERSFVLRRFEYNDSGFSWRKDWRQIVSADESGRYPVAHVAEVLWDRFIADGGKNLGVLERAHLYALLGTETGLAGFLDPDKLAAVYSENELMQEPFATRLSDLGATLVPIDSDNITSVERASYRIGQAVNFIAATPYAFYTEGK